MEGLGDELFVEVFIFDEGKGFVELLVQDLFVHFFVFFQI